MNFDKPLFFSVLGLVVFGLVMMSSMSIAVSYNVTGENDFYFWRHFWYLVIGVPIFLAGLKFPLEWLRRMSLLGFLTGIFLLILVLTLGESFGTAAKSWLKIGPFSMQPTELVKLFTVIFLATIFSSGKNNAASLTGGFVPFALVLGIPAVLIIAQPDFGSLLVLAGISSAIYFAAGASWRHFCGGVAIAGCAATFITLTTPYILHRVKVFLDPSLDPLSTGFQVKQALIAIGSGGLFGRGFQNSIQKFDYLPEVQSDTIFSAISEEMGFFRILLLLAVYLLIAQRGFWIAKNVSSDFYKLLAVGITVWIVGQSFINIGVNLALLPNTGITLPFISYGGTSLWASLAAVGILLQISSNASKSKRRRHFF